MKHPQDKAIELVNSLKNLETIAESACCAFTALWWTRAEVSDEEAIKIINDALIAGVLGDDCSVIWQPFIKWLTGRDVEIEFQIIDSIENIKEKTPVRFDYNGRSHWVGVENGEIKFNAKAFSNCVEKGKPAAARIIKIKK